MMQLWGAFTSVRLLLAQAVVHNAQHYVLERKTWIAKRMFPQTVDIDVITTLLITDAVCASRLQYRSVKAAAGK